MDQLVSVRFFSICQKHFRYNCRITEKTMTKIYIISLKNGKHDCENLFLMVFLIFGLSFPTAAETITGQARIIDGDTLQIAKTRIRLHGIDTPEIRQFCDFNSQKWPCGVRAKERLKALISGQQVHCNKRDMDRYGRIVAVCFSNGINLNASLVAGGWGLAYRRYSKDYVDEEIEARTNRRGMWRGSFISPWEWRHQRRFFKRKRKPITR